jgi:hypothetical protein
MVQRPGDSGSHTGYSGPSAIAVANGKRPPAGFLDPLEGAGTGATAGAPSAAHAGLFSTSSSNSGGTEGIRRGTDFGT